MSYEPPTPENNVILRQLAGMRRESAEARELNLRVIELVGRMNVRLDEMSTRHDQGLARVERRIAEMQGDMVLMENRIITAIHEVRNIAARLDDAETATAAVVPPIAHG